MESWALWDLAGPVGSWEGLPTVSVGDQRRWGLITLQVRIWSWRFLWAVSPPLSSLPMSKSLWVVCKRLSSLLVPVSLFPPNTSTCCPVCSEARSSCCKRTLQISPFLWRSIHLDFFSFPAYLATYKPYIYPCHSISHGHLLTPETKSVVPFAGVTVCLHFPAAGQSVPVRDQFHLLISFSTPFAFRSVSFWTINVVLTLYYPMGSSDFEFSQH